MVYVEVVFQHNDSYNETSLSFVNNIITGKVEHIYLDLRCIDNINVLMIMQRKNNLLKERKILKW